MLISWCYYHACGYIEALKNKKTMTILVESNKDDCNYEKH